MTNTIPMGNFPGVFRPYNNVQPFTYRDGASFLEIIEGLRSWLGKDVIPHLDKEFAELVESWELNIKSLADKIVENKDEYATALVDFAAEIEASIDAQTATIDGKIAANDSRITQSLNANKAYVDAAVASIVNVSITVTDAIINGTFSNIDTAFRRAVESRLNSAIDNRKHPLTNMIEKVKKGGKARALITGTSLAAAPMGTARRIIPHLAAIYGDAKTNIATLGDFGGSFDNIPKTGWAKQRYGGWGATRLVGNAGSGTLSANGINFVGDYFIIRWSTETTSQPADIYIDDVLVGQTTGPGAQKYGANELRFDLPWGSHKWNLGSPIGSTGAVYYESYETGDSKASGFEQIDATMGGMGMKHMSEILVGSPSHVAPIPIVGTNGLDWHFKRTNIDLYIIQHQTNDGAIGPFKTAMDYAVEQARLQGVPVLIFTEPSQDPGAEWYARYFYLLSLRKHGHVTVIDWHQAIFTTPPSLMHSLYYAGSDTTHPSYPAYEVSDHMVSTALNIPTFKTPTIVGVENDKMLKFVAPVNPAPRNIALDKDGVNPNGVTVITPEGIAIIPLVSPFITNKTVKRDFYYRAPVRNNNYASQQRAISSTPTGTDAYGKYVDYNGGALYTNGPSEALEIWTLTVKIAPRVINTNVEVNLSAVWQVVDPNGNPVRNNGTSNLFIYQPTLNSDEPITLAISFRRLSSSSADNGNVTLKGKVYDLTLSRSTVPVFDTNTRTGGMDFVYKSLPKQVEVAQIVTPSAPKIVRYGYHDFVAYEFRGLKTGTDIYQYDGELVRGYRETRAVNQYSQINNEIIASSTSTQWGKYISPGDRSLDFSTWGMAIGDVRRVTVRASGNFAIKAENDARISVNGKDAMPSVTGTQYARFFGVSQNEEPAIYTVEIYKRTNGGGSVQVSGRVYELSVTDSSVPLLTNPSSVL